MTVIKTPACIDYAEYYQGFDFELRSGEVSFFIRGTATVVLDDRGAPVMVVWEKDE